MKCPQCNVTELTGRQKYCSDACKQAAHRVKKMGGVHAEKIITDEHPSRTETYSERLDRRIQETGSVGRKPIKVGYPEMFEVEVPSKHEMEDLDAAVEEVKTRLGKYPRQPVTKAVFEKREPIS